MSGILSKIQRSFAPQVNSSESPPIQLDVVKIWKEFQNLFLLFYCFTILIIIQSRWKIASVRKKIFFEIFVKSSGIERELVKNMYEQIKNFHENFENK
jgi:hypothetical protein